MGEHLEVRKLHQVQGGAALIISLKTKIKMELEKVQKSSQESRGNKD